MSHAFPSLTVEYVQELTRRFKAENPTYDLLGTAKGLHESISKADYSFRDNLHTGNYAHYVRETEGQVIQGFNCTTIIPFAYLLFEGIGVKPQIVQFFGFRDIEDLEDKDKPKSNQHFALILDLGRKRKYLADPFWETFGPIIREEDHCLKLPNCRREFDTMIRYSPEEFASMMERLKDPAESLDMLVAGQRVYGARRVNKRRCELMVFYDDVTNTVTTRLEIPQTAIQNKYVYCCMEYGEQGNITGVSLELYYAKESHWTQLTEAIKIGSLSFRTLAEVRRLLNPIVNLKKQDRLTLALSDKKAAQPKASLTEIVDTLMKRLTLEEVAAVRRQVYARMLYDATRMEDEYLFTDTERDQHLHELYKEHQELDRELASLLQPLILHNWKIVRLPLNEARKLKWRKKKIEKRKEKKLDELESLKRLRYFERAIYDRTMDKVLFAEKIKSYSEDDLCQRMDAECLDPRIGYLAMVADFIPYVFSARNDLTLKIFQASLQEKIRARRQRNQ